MNSNPRQDLSARTGMKKPVNQRLGHQGYGQGNNIPPNQFNAKSSYQFKAR